jgi:drug/metabolite transporter (DMT)-like permease
MNNERLKIVGGFVVTSLIWGSTWMFIKIGLESIPPFYSASFRFFIAMFILWLINRIRSSPFPTDAGSRKVYMIVGLSSFAIPYALVYWGQQYIPTGLSSILFALYPLMVGIFSHYFLPSEPLNLYKITGILLGFLGIVLIFAQDVHWDKGNSTLGMAAILFSSVLQAASLIVIKKQARHMDSFHLNLGSMLIGSIVLFVLALFFENISDINFDIKAISSIFYLGILGSVITFSIYFWMLKHIEAVYISLLTFITPILAVVFGAIILKEKLDFHIFYGGALVLTGILISNGQELIKTMKNQLVKIE